MKKKTISYINGEYLSFEKSKLSIYDLGLERGYGAFIHFRTYNKKPFHIEDHLDRLFFSAKKLHIQVVFKKEEISSIITKLFHINQLDEAAIKVFITGGTSVDFLKPFTNPSLIIQVGEVPKYPPHLYTEGIKLATFALQPFLPECKTLNYMPGILALQSARNQQAFEALYLNPQNQLLECSTSNFFAFKKGQLLTPHNQILLGITRQVVLNIAKNDFPIETRDVFLDEIQDFEEAFITASNKQIIPVMQINQKVINNGKVGEKTKKIMHLFYDYTQKDTWPKLNIAYPI